VPRGRHLPDLDPSAKADIAFSLPRFQSPGGRPVGSMILVDGCTRTDAPNPIRRAIRDLMDTTLRRRNRLDTLPLI
jgi:hypothetical protein